MKAYSYPVLYNKNAVPIFLKGIDKDALKLLNFCATSGVDDTFHYYDKNYKEIRALDDLGLIKMTVNGIKNTVYLSLTFKGWWVWWNAHNIAWVEHRFGSN